MATLRKGKCYREVKRAYTRKSKYKKKGFVKSTAAIKIVNTIWVILVRILRKRLS